MPLFAETEEKIIGDILFDIVDGTNVSRASPGSKMRSLVQAVSKKMGLMYNTFDLNVVQAFLDGAEGKYLGFIGDMMGVPRLGEEGASVTSLERNIKFSVDVGTFGSINSGSPILIPRGTLISTAANGQGTAYRVTASTILLSTDTEAFVPAEALKTGSSSNVGPRQLIFHNFTNYTDSISNTLKVTNEADLLTGADLEIDTNYRFRIANQVLAVEKANETAIRIAALVVPGVADVVVIPFNRGIGTYDILIKSTTPVISETLVATVQEAIDRVTSQGIVGLARAPRELGISMVGTITFKRTLTPEEQSAVFSAISDNVEDYINSLDIGEEFLTNEVLERVLVTSDEIKKLGSLSQPFDSLFIHKPSKLEDNKVRGTLLDDYEPEVDERIIVENRFAGSTPILFRAA